MAAMESISPRQSICGADSNVLAIMGCTASSAMRSPSGRKLEPDDVVDAQGLELQHHWREVGSLQLWHVGVAQRLSRKHLPGLVRPARPARCDAEALDTGVVVSDSMPVSASYVRIFTKPQSTTKAIPSMVTDASAMFVEKMTLRVPSGGLSNTYICCSVDRPA
ncbi:hypothetical protein L249_3264 [Ophiocordyceps polyrhachis-furcata BCC 54312]|uniref:Uncharacterized protein n=1 Tax=Ophiocordyceps polyrhachis-furcata BCC 54312 TaxID=1330021 RepID=A0A367LP15_9HYPO|nr:hypothetical protein L249_3264 [Ophiocordyceps polyrhachis-furcata BCC 54312]